LLQVSWQERPAEQVAIAFAGAPQSCAVQQPATGAQVASGQGL
jgi:hypothetical protein